MEEQILLIIKIPCEEDGQEYKVNYPSVKSFKSRPAPEAWKPVKVYSRTWKEDVQGLELQFYHGETCIATLLVKRDYGSRYQLIEIQLSDEWLVKRGKLKLRGPADLNEQQWKNKYGVYYSGDQGTPIYYLSATDLWSDLADMLPAKRLLVEGIINFVRELFNEDKRFFQLPKPDNQNSWILAQKILTDYVTLNPGIFNELGLPDPRSNPGDEISIPPIIWDGHREQFKKLTRQGCISVWNDFRHDDLDLALKIAVNPLLATCYQKLYEYENTQTTEKVAELNEVFTKESTQAQSTSIDLTGMNFSAVFSFDSKIPFAPGEFIDGQPKLTIFFDYAKFNYLKLNGENAEKDCNWAKVSLRHASFCGSKLQKINFAGADLTGANFESAKLINIDLRDADIEDANFKDATLEFIKWPLVKYEDKVFHLPNLNWEQYGADFILQQLEQLGQKPESEISIKKKQKWAKALFDKALSNIHTSEELVKFEALIDGKENKFAYLRQETQWFRGSFFECHGNTDTWHDIIGKLKIHLDIILARGIVVNGGNVKNWKNQNQLEAFHKIMSEHRGRGFGEVTHTKLYRRGENGNQYYTALSSSEDMVKLRNSYIDEDKGFKDIIENAFGQKQKLF